MPLRVAAISFLNPAPLLYDFEHEPAASALRERYEVHYTSPSACAGELVAGTADLGLIPIAALTPEMAIVPGCTIASLQEVRSILLLVKNPLRLRVEEVLAGVKTVAADAASRSSQAYAHILFEHFHGVKPRFVEHAADPLAMLAVADAALLIGDPALLARACRAEIEAAAETPLLWLDLAQLWRERTGLPWVAAVWAVRPEALAREGVSAQQLVDDLVASRDAGMAHVEQLVAEWTPRIAISPATIRTYLTQNIHYVLDEDCLRAIVLFRELAAEIGLLAPLPELNLLS
jgi:chorismate dehydratase